MNFQIFKLDFKKAEELEIKLPTPAGSQKKTREFQKNIYFCFINYAKAFDCMAHTHTHTKKKNSGNMPSKNLFP